MNLEDLQDRAQDLLHGPVEAMVDAVMGLSTAILFLILAVGLILLAPLWVPVWLYRRIF